MAGASSALAPQFCACQACKDWRQATRGQHVPACAPMEHAKLWTNIFLRRRAAAALGLALAGLANGGLCSGYFAGVQTEHKRIVLHPPHQHQFGRPWPDSSDRAFGCFIYYAAGSHRALLLVLHPLCHSRFQGLRSHFACCARDQKLSASFSDLGV